MSDAHDASCKLRQLARGYRYSIELIVTNYAVNGDLAQAVVEAQGVIDALELGAAALDTVHTFGRDTDGPPLCPFCKMPYNPNPTGLVS